MRIGRIILFAALAALLLLGGRTLVEGPEAAAQTASLPLPPLHAVLEAADAPVNAAAAETPLQAERIRRCILPERQQTPCAWRLPLTDGNGCPLASRSYTDAAYIAFPPEGERG